MRPKKASPACVATTIFNQFLEGDVWSLQAKRGNFNVAGKRNPAGSTFKREFALVSRLDDFYIACDRENDVYKVTVFRKGTPPELNDLYGPFSLDIWENSHGLQIEFCFDQALDPRDRLFDLLIEMRGFAVDLSPRAKRARKPAAVKA